MLKDRKIVLRVEAATKTLFEEAARKMGKSVTTFLVESGMKAARSVESQPVVRGRHTGCPTYFKACCHEASQGGELGYKRPARELSRHLASEVPYDISDEDWRDELEELSNLLAVTRPDGDAVWSWFVTHYPRCMELIPKRRRDQFLDGVYQAYEEEIIELE
jgi:hypothetical protein